MVEDTVYKEYGYNNREDYIRGVAEIYDLDVGTVWELAELLGPDEDFDGLISEVEAYTNY